METSAKPEEICCPEFNSESWDDRVLEWKDKPFIKDRVKTFFYMPLNFGSVMTRFDKKTRGAGVKVPDALCLSDHTSKWNMDLYLAVDKEIPGETNVKLSGRFYSRVYEGPYKDTGKWCADYDKQAHEKGMDIKKSYMWYTTCPKCAKKYGKNPVVILGEVN
jgi:hypothetical protein